MIKLVALTLITAILGLPTPTHPKLTISPMLESLPAGIASPPAPRPEPKALDVALDKPFQVIHDPIPGAAEPSSESSTETPNETAAGSISDSSQAEQASTEMKVPAGPQKLRRRNRSVGKLRRRSLGPRLRRRQPQWGRIRRRSHRTFYGPIRRRSMNRSRPIRRRSYNSRRIARRSNPMY